MKRFLKKFLKYFLYVHLFLGVAIVLTHCSVKRYARKSFEVARKEKPFDAIIVPGVPYDTAKDVGFYAAKGNYYKSNKKVFFIVFPDDAHRPGIKVDGFPTEKKIVIKVRRGK